jgi:RNase P subunit RPR2
MKSETWACLDCGREYRHATEGADGFCARCCRLMFPDDTQQSRTEHEIQLRGNATRPSKQDRRTA